MAGYRVEQCHDSLSPYKEVRIMRFVSFTGPDRAPGYGQVIGDRVVDLTRRLGPEASSLCALIASGRLAETAALGLEPDLVLADLIQAPVIPDPDKIICVGLNYRDHVAESGQTVTEKPALIARFRASQVGHLQPLIKPSVSDEFDYEGELAVIIGRGGRHVPASEALHHVAGYACYNEGTVRDWQRHTSQYLAGKTFAGTGGFGPGW